MLSVQRARLLYPSAFPVDTFPVLIFHEERAVWAILTSLDLAEETDRSIHDCHSSSHLEAAKPIERGQNCSSASRADSLDWFHESNCCVFPNAPEVRRAAFVRGSLDEILEWEQRKEKERGRVGLGGSLFVATLRGGTELEAAEF